MPAEATFREAFAEPMIRAIPLSHVSIEVARVNAEDLAAGPGYLQRWFQGIKPWVEAAHRSCAEAVPRRKARISTCVLVDDYSSTFSEPGAVIAGIREAATSAGVSIDYVARQAGLVDADGLPLTAAVLDRLVSDPPPGTAGWRPPPGESGWASNGQRTPAMSANEAMSGTRAWQPPAQNATDQHSIFVDVELWSGPAEARVWSPSFLAAVWQLVRLGVLRFNGEPVTEPWAVEGDLPTLWSALPAVLRLNPKAAPFSAYRTLSLLGLRYLPVHQAVRTILGQVALDSEILRRISERAAGEGILLDGDVVGRAEFVCLRD